MYGQPLHREHHAGHTHRRGEDQGRVRPGILRRVLRFAAPAGLVTAAAAYTAYAIARAETDTDTGDARTTATLVTTALGVWILARLAQPLSPLRIALIAGMAGAFVGIMAIPPLRDTLALRPLPLDVWASAAVLTAIAAPLMIILHRVADRVLPSLPSPPSKP